MIEKIHLSVTVDCNLPTRLDQYLSEIQTQYSRSRWQEWIKAGEIYVNQKAIQKPNFKVQFGDTIEADITPEAQVEWAAQPLPLNIIFEDDSLIILNKPDNCVVHPAAGHHENTLVNALLHHAPELDKLPRAGIIHRLDKDTTGLLVVPKTLEAHHALTQQLQARTMKREYVAIVYGNVISGGTIDKSMGRHPKIRTKMAVIPNGKEAVTHYKIKTRMNGFTELAIQLETGRTHQIRVHLSAIKYPIVGDQTYCGKPLWPKGTDEATKVKLSQFKRQALHAYRLTLDHPKTHEAMSWQCEPPDDYKELLNFLSNCF